MIDLFDDLDDKSKEDLKSCWVLDGNTSLKVNLNDSLFIFLNTNNCVWYQHFGSNSMIRDSAEYYFRGKKVNQQALLTNGGYYETLVPKLWRVRSDNSLELMEKSLSDQLIIEGMFTSIPILVKHSDGKRWWILLPRANSTQAAVYLTSHESLEYSHESYYPSISPSPQDYQYTFRNYLEGDICSVSPLGNYLAFYRYINHADYNGELSVYQFDRCTGKIGTLFAQYFIPIQKLESTKQLMHPILTYKDRVMRDERIEKMISSMVLVAREIGLNHSIDSLQWYSYEREIFFSPKEDQIIFKDPNLNYIHCKLSQNGDFGSSCRVLNDTFIKNSIFRKEFDETNQVRWSDLTQLPNFDLLLSNYINHKSNNTIEEEHVAIKFSANPNQNPTFSSLLQERRLVGEPWMHHFQPTQSHPMYPIHYRMPPLARDCISVIPDEPKFKLFPNPTSGQFYIESNDKDIYFQSLEIYSMSGIKVHERALDPRQVYQEINEDISNVPQGLYIVLLRDIFGSARFRGKLVKIN